MTKLGFMAVDEFGATYHIGNNPPRKWLLEYFNRQHCQKMYRDTKDGKTQHVGYIIGSHWLEVFTVCAWKEAV